MAKKRKSDATRLDEVDRTVYKTFCGAANSLSQLYSQAMNQQKHAFQAGERHSLDKLYQWILRQHEEGSRVSTSDILTYLQNELDYGGGDDPSMSPRPQFQRHQNFQATLNQGINSGNQISAASVTPAATIWQQGPNRSGYSSDNQIKNSVFSNALSSPIRQTLQHCHLVSQGGGPRSNETNISPQHHNRENDSSMDMHADGPGQDSPY
ncbi:hypothetical protein GIB67_003731 [Kingdonia uniflora]|uniref:Holocarboxylase synthetase n=1 Tax=Kingdonia uniflora TaxID=39325 RepID=A0A7J7MSD9_9MAGN|nr:hypothetical protein GIB67_003731 [Kingdonia uniflora]